MAVNQLEIGKVLGVCSICTYMLRAGRATSLLWLDTPCVILVFHLKHGGQLDQVEMRRCRSNLEKEWM